NHRGIGSTLIHHFRHRRPGRLGMVRAKACLNNPRVITSHRLTHPTVMLQTRDKIPAGCTPHMIHVMRYGKCRISMVIPALRPNLAVGGPLAQLFVAPESLAPRSCSSVCVRSCPPGTTNPARGNTHSTPRARHT